MATFTLTIPDAQVPRIQASFIDAGITPKQFLIDQLKAWVRAYEERVARDAALAAVTPPASLDVT